MGFYLPKFSSRNLTRRYLQNLGLGKSWRIKRKFIKEYVSLNPKIKSIHLIKEIRKYIPEEFLDIDDDAVPEKQWCTNILFILNPDHRFFTNGNNLKFNKNLQKW